MRNLLLYHQTELELSSICQKARLQHTTIFTSGTHTAQAVSIIIEWD